MQRDSLATRYAPTMIAMHWLTLLLIAAVYLCIELRELYPRGSDPREALKAWHFTLGLSVFALVWLRLLLRWIGPIPPVNPRLPTAQRIGAGAVHVALYALMIGMPIGGWLLLSTSGKPIPFWGFELPALLAPDRALADLIKEIHETAGKVGYGLIGVHAAAALYHHFVRRDDTMMRMLPRRRH